MTMTTLSKLKGFLWVVIFLETFWIIHTTQQGLLFLFRHFDTEILHNMSLTFRGSRLWNRTKEHDDIQQMSTVGIKPHHYVVFQN